MGKVNNFINHFIIHINWNKKNLVILGVLFTPPTLYEFYSIYQALAGNTQSPAEVLAFLICIFFTLYGQIGGIKFMDRPSRKQSESNKRHIG
ncbi:membrane protein [Cuniculiplasma divulgatum]|jgi:hypothetical protein|uniref:Membrane protein n=1 Tax=Cuniculiplasma divulgatum TaxID=1673428 RepID=A0A1N5TT01_9ARCH|nr:membrane protein [Cuniculiplasma divulgatum]